jgi:ABC-type Fe3+-hydroxamate transport system substrate-binding protein
MLASLPAGQSGAMTLSVKDAFGQPFEMAAPARRIISLVPSITEIFFALGAGDRVVGVTKYCTEPPEGVAARPKVGGQKNPRLDAIIDLKPDLVVANVEENRKEHVEALRTAGLPVLVTYPRTVHEGIHLIRDLGVLTATTDLAELMAVRCETALAEVEGVAGGRPPVRVFCPIWRTPYMTINRDTFVNDMLRASGGENIFLDHPKRYPTVTLGEVAARRPEVILLPDEPFPFEEKHLAEVHTLGDVPAVRAGRLHLLDGKVLSWYGPRIAPSLRTLAKLLLQ